LSYDDSLDKDRLYFTQNNSPIRLRCPECVRTKILRHCRIFKNLPALWWHIKQDHGSFSNLLFKTDDIIKILNSLSKAIEWKIITESVSFPVEQATTTSSLLYRERPPRKDVYQKLEKIASILQLQSEHYPHYRLKNIRKFMGIVLGKVDDRTIKNYLDCIVDASEKNKINGTVDVTQFCLEFNSGV